MPYNLYMKIEQLQIANTKCRILTIRHHYICDLKLYLPDFTLYKA